MDLSSNRGCGPREGGIDVEPAIDQNWPLNESAAPP